MSRKQRRAEAAQANARGRALPRMFGNDDAAYDRVLAFLASEQDTQKIALVLRKAAYYARNKGWITAKQARSFGCV